MPQTKQGFTLVELITVLAIIGIGMALFYSTLFVNWVSLEKQLSLIDLQMEADKIIEMLSFDGKFAQQFTATGSQVTFSYPSSSPITYTITSAGELEKTDASGTSVISEYIDNTNSSFVQAGNSLQVNLTLNDFVLGKRVELEVFTQICPRNLL